MGEVKIRWSDLSAYTRTRFPGVVTLLPVLGYAVLFSDELNTWFFNYGDFLQSGWLSPQTRILLVFVGAVFLAVGRLVFLVCPSAIRQFPTVDGYVSYYVSHPDRAELKFSVDLIKKNFPQIAANTVPDRDELIGSQPYKLVVERVVRIGFGPWVEDSGGETRAIVLRAAYELMDSPRDVLVKGMKRTCFCFYAGGTLLFLVPSFEVTLLALGQAVTLLTGVFPNI